MVDPLARRGRTIGMCSLDARSGGSTTPPYFKRVGGDRPLIGLLPFGTNEGIGVFPKGC